IGPLTGHIGETLKPGTCWSSKRLHLGSKMALVSTVERRQVSTDSSGSIKIPSFQTTELMTSGYRMRPSQRTKNLRHSYLLGHTSGWQLPGSAFYAPPRRRTLSTIRCASPSAQPQLWIISNHSQGLTFQNISAALSRPRIPLLLADVFHYLVAFKPWLCFRSELINRDVFTHLMHNCVDLRQRCDIVNAIGAFLWKLKEKAVRTKLYSQFLKRGFLTHQFSVFG
ncbi:hypothetical protein ATANTOWER_030990, partial [Ataeniobius toweri]|nr:hypothetical protein [Ataeniobius toweri]